MRRFSKIVGPLLLLLIVSGFFWKLFTKQYTWMDHPDMATQVLPWYQFQATSWQHGEFPLWDPHIWGGQPLLGQILPGAAYPPNWLLFLLPLKDGHIQQRWPQWMFVLTHFFGALFCYWLCIDLGRTRAASILGGVAFALSGVVGSLGWPQLLDGAIWIPLVLMFSLRSIRGERPIANAAFSGTFLGVAFLSGHHQIPTFTALTMAVLWLVELWRRRAGALRPAVIFGLFTFLTGALQLLPGYEYGVNSLRMVGLPYAIAWDQSVPYTMLEQYSLSPREILGFVLPPVSEHEAFVGLVVFTLALLGFTAGFRIREVRIFGAVVLGSLLVALGGFSVFNGVAYILIPLVNKSRSPVMALAVTQFAIAVLAAFGLDALRRAEFGRWWIPSLTVAGILPWPALAVMATVRPQTSREYDHLAIFGLVALALAAILQVWKSRRVPEVAVVGTLILLTLFELGTFTGQNYIHRDHPAGFLAQLDTNKDVVAFLRAQPDLVRLEVDMNVVPYNIGDWDNLDQMRATLGGITNNVAHFDADPIQDGRLSEKLFALTYYLGREPKRPDQQEVFRGESGLVVYRNPNAFPRLWTVHESASVPDRDLTARLRQTDLRRKVLLIGPAPALASCDGDDQVKLLSRGNMQLAIEARMACRGMVIASETDFPGWEATIDGRAVPIQEAYGALRGVVVEAGTHRIEMHYRPKMAYAGGLLSAAGFAAAIVMAFRRAPNTRKETRHKSSSTGVVVL